MSDDHEWEEGVEDSLDGMQDEDDDYEDDGAGLFLVFRLHDALYLVQASRVGAVISWRSPVPLPGSGSTVRGVIQDRGRVIAVLESPTARRAMPQEAAPEEPSRVLICPTTLGYLGIPATETLAVEPTDVDPEAPSGTLISSTHGALTYVNPEDLAAEVVAAAYPTGAAPDPG